MAEPLEQTAALLGGPLAAATGLLSALAGIGFLMISLIVARHLQGGAWRVNPLATGIALVFFTSGILRLLHTLQLLYPILGIQGEVAAYAPLHYGEWIVLVAEGATAAAVVAYLTLRQRVPGIVKAGAIYDDLRRRRDQALSVHDEVVQRLVRAQWYAQMGRANDAASVLDELVAQEESILERLAGHARETRALQEETA